MVIDETTTAPPDLPLGWGFKIGIGLFMLRDNFWGKLRVPFVRGGGAAVTAVSLLVVLCMCLLADPALAKKKKAGLKSGQIRIAYVTPKNPEHQPLFELLKKRKILETFRELLSPVRLPSPLTLKLEGCDGVSNAWYEDQAVSVCYEYIAEVVKWAPKETTPLGVSREDAIIGPVAEVFLHEVGHALFDMLNVPLLGREEDAADQVAAYVLLRFGKEEARRLIGGVALMYAREAKEDQSPAMKQFADVHGLPAQRFYNVLCIAYGAYPDLFKDIVDKGHLPTSRAEDCNDEYNQVALGFNRLIAPNFDPALLKKVRAKKWLRPTSATTAPAAR